MRQIRKNLRQITAMALTVVMVFSTAGCGADKQTAVPQESSTVAASESSVVTEVSSEAETQTAEVSPENDRTASEAKETEALPIQTSSEDGIESSGNASSKEEKPSSLDVPSSTAEAVQETTEFSISTTGEPESASDDGLDSIPTLAGSAAETHEPEASSVQIPETVVSNVTQEQPSELTEPTSFNDETLENEFEEEQQELTDAQRNSVNMLNYMTLLTEQINENRGNQIFLDSAYLSLKNDIFPKVDTKTQGQITRLMDTIEEYRMILVKRERLNFIYEQNRAQALRKAIPNPVGLLSAVQSGSLLKAAASVLYMAVDAKASYDSATSQADLQFIKDGWELDSAESEQIHNSTTTALNYMFNMVRDYDLPGDYALSAEAVEDFVTWSSKPDSQLVNKIRWLESHEGTYKIYGPYWLERAKDYYNSERYQDCLDCIKQYETVSTRIFRTDIDYATILPMAIISAKETMDEDDYVKAADRYCSVILNNTKDANWSLRYFVAQIYLDLYHSTKNQAYLNNAYQISYDNVNELVYEQKSLNENYLAPIQEVKNEKNATKRQKEETKRYNKLIKEERKVALPPVSEAFYLNCDLLFALAEEINISESEKRDIEATLHENGANIFLTQALDDRFWFDNNEVRLKADEIDVSFDGNKMTIPASCVTDRSTIIVTVKGSDGSSTLNDWVVTNVKRPKNTDCSGFIVYYESKIGGKYKYKAGDSIIIWVIPVSETPDSYYEFAYAVEPVKVAFVFNGVKFERVTK